MQAKDHAPYWARAHTAPAPQAALCNGTAIHGFELDDLLPASIVHPGTVIVPAVFAAAEASNASGMTLLARHRRRLRMHVEAEPRSGARAVAPRLSQDQRRRARGGGDRERRGHGFVVRRARLRGGSCLLHGVGYQGVRGRQRRRDGQAHARRPRGGGRRAHEPSGSTRLHRSACGSRRALRPAGGLRRARVRSRIA